MRSTKEKTTEFRCRSCNRKLAEGMAIKLSIKCPRCGFINSFERHERLDDRSHDARSIFNKTEIAPGLGRGQE